MRGRRDDPLGRWVSILYRRRDAYFERELAPHGIGPGAFRMLRALYRKLVHEGQESVNQTEAARFLHLDKGAAARAMKKLDSAGFITRQRSLEDSREYRIRLTRKAEELHDEFHGIRKRWTGILSRGFSAEERAETLHLLERMAENAEANLAQQRSAASRKG